MTKTSLQLSLNDTQVLKGVALLLLLCHHCLYEGKDYVDIWFHGKPLFQTFGIFSKLCVAIFVFLSGYGLTASTMKKGGLGGVFAFYRHRYAKLMVNFWFIWLLFVPMGVFFFGRTFPSVYGNHYVIKAIVDFLGLYQGVYGTPMGYNPTWWFYSCIIVLYFLYPLIWKCRRYWFLMLPLCFIFKTMVIHIPVVSTSGCNSYMLSFICGIVLAYLRPCISVNSAVKIILILLLYLLCKCRLIMSNPLLWDCAITLYIIAIYKVIGIPTCFSKGLAFLGRHSMNIFLFHTFIFYLYLHDLIYWSRNPILICLTLLIVCIPISITIEWLKNRLCINQLQNRLSGQ